MRNIGMLDRTSPAVTGGLYREPLKSGERQSMVGLIVKSLAADQLKVAPTTLSM